MERAAPNTLPTIDLPQTWPDDRVAPSAGAKVTAVPADARPVESEQRAAQNNGAIESARGPNGMSHVSFETARATGLCPAIMDEFLKAALDFALGRRR